MIYAGYGNPMTGQQSELQYSAVNLIDHIEYAKADKIQRGKVRDSFVFGDKRAIVVTDRVSAFDHALGLIPNKGAILNTITNWWFKKLDLIGVKHHYLDSPHPNIAIVQNIDIIPLEMVVRAFLTGSTTTSSWYAYNHLDRMICGVEMPEGMKKNQQFSDLLLTPTTKDPKHDEPISEKEILESDILKPFAIKADTSVSELWQRMKDTSIQMFQFGQDIALERGLILVDTKYEMGIDGSGNLMVADEVHTPDCSRYWINKTYKARFKSGEEPDALDKEFLRGMIIQAGYDIESDKNLRDFMTDTIINEAADKYQDLLWKITREELRLTSEDSIVAVLDSIR